MPQPFTARVSNNKLSFLTLLRSRGGLGEGEGAEEWGREGGRDNWREGRKDGTDPV